MAHGITETDGLVLHKERAWHGLGTVVEEAPTPYDALCLANLNWDVAFTNGVGGQVEYPSMMEGDTVRPVHANDWKLVVRMDNNDVLGCVSKNYSAIQNKTVADFAEALAEGNDIVKVESAGSLFGGKRVFYLLKSESFDVGANDEVVPYILLSNSHDGSLSFSARPTSIRVVCDNTLTWALNGSNRNIFRLKHTKNLMANINEARKALELYAKGVPVFKEKCDMLQKIEFSGRMSEKEYFNRMWETLNGPVEVGGLNEEDQHNRRYAREGWVDERRDELAQQCINRNQTSTLWTAFNAVTEDIQSQKTAYGDRYLSNRLFGQAEDKTNKVWAATLAQAGSF